ncbi:hypothetical protein GGI23_002104 [Coemansia sp. RSA 2559]|nr:hypothetical protein GGI23_002104 [Coemansia sp. RSA 2559]KAJ2864800.1 hypothetical protein GGI22_001642 [Coemansia erecta]
MKFTTALLTLASAAAAAENTNLGAILSAMPSDIAGAMTYLPSDFISSLMVGEGTLPTDFNSLVALAPGLPTSEIPHLSSEYVQFMSSISSLLPTPSETSSSGSSSSGASSGESSSSAVSGSSSNEELSDDSSDASEESGSIESSEDESNNESSDESSHEHDSSSSHKDNTESSGATKVACSVAAALVAIVALF